METSKGHHMLHTLLARRTHLAFRDTPVPESALNHILEAGMLAPTRFHQRPWHFIILRDEGIKQEIAGALRLKPSVAGAPVWIAVVTEENGPASWDLDAAAAAQSMLIAATALGLGSAWLMPWLSNPDALGEAEHLLGLPQDIHLAMLLAVGYPAEDLPAHRAEEVYEPRRVHREQVRHSPRQAPVC
ncbi:MAG: nitroreductase family protein [Anaerolineae bacterium]